MMPRMLPLFALFACTSTPSADDSLAAESAEVTDFLLDDVNPNSARSGDAVSPRDYLGDVSGWYFIHST
jgi:hypothetical protein